MISINLNFFLLSLWGNWFWLRLICVEEKKGFSPTLFSSFHLINLGFGLTSFESSGQTKPPSWHCHLPHLFSTHTSHLKLFEGFLFYHLRIFTWLSCVSALVVPVKYFSPLCWGYECVVESTKTISENQDSSGCLKNKKTALFYLILICLYWGKSVWWLFFL